MCRTSFRGPHDRICAVLVTACTSDEMSAEIHKATGNALLAAKKPVEALAAYEAGLAIDPAHSALLSNKAAVLLELGRPVDAESAARRCVESAPSWSKAHYRLGAALEALRRVADAQAAYEAALRLEPTSEVLRACCARLSSVPPVGLAWISGARVFTQHAYWADDAEPTIATVAAFKAAHAPAAASAGLSPAQVTAEQSLFDVPFIWGAMGPGGVDAVELPPRASLLCSAVRFIVTAAPPAVVRKGEPAFVFPATSIRASPQTPRAVPSVRCSGGVRCWAAGTACRGSGG